MAKKQMVIENGNNLKLRMGAMICMTILGFITIIGTFWGNQGLKNVGIGLATVFIILIFGTGNRDIG